MAQKTYHGRCLPSKLEYARLEIFSSLGCNDFTDAVAAGELKGLYEW